MLEFQVKSAAEWFWAERTERFRKFALERHPEKTRLRELGPLAAANWKRGGEGKPETFNFLGLTPIGGKKRSQGMLTVVRPTRRQRMQAKPKAVKTELRPRRRLPLPDRGQGLPSVGSGHFRS